VSFNWGPFHPLWNEQTRIPLAIEEPPRMGDYYANTPIAELIQNHPILFDVKRDQACRTFEVFLVVFREWGPLQLTDKAAVVASDAFAFGALKYGRVGDWRTVPLDKHLQSAGRHFHAWLKDPASICAESGLTHEAHFLARAVMIQEIRRTR
jgi:hypothetical protein